MAEIDKKALLRLAVPVPKHLISGGEQIVRPLHIVSTSLP